MSPLPLTPMEKQSGAVLLLSLIMVLVLSLSAVAMFNVNNVNQQIVLNQINTMEAEELGNEVIESLLNDLSEFRIASTKQFQGLTHQILDGRYDRDNLEVSVLNFRCTNFETVAGYSRSGGASLIQSTTPPQTYYYEFDVQVSSPITGAAVRMTQGVRFNGTAGECP